MVGTDWYVDFAQLWVEEQQLLAELAALVPADGTIVEIGTAQGGSAYIFHRTTVHKEVNIYSYDIAPLPEAYEHLKNTSVTIIAKPSTEGALTWMQTVGQPIDLLFIDGSHTLQHLFEDFNSWVSFLKPGGRVVFHDYDPVERGGLAHLGVRVCLDAILRCQLLNQPIHQYRMLHGTIEHPGEIQLDETACYQSFGDLGRQIVRIRDSDYTGWAIVDSGSFAKLLRYCLKIDHTAVPILPEQATDPNRKYLVSARPLVAAIDLLRGRGIPEDSIVAIDSLQACYLLARAIETNRDHLLTLTSSSSEFMRWEEILFMFEHAFGASQFPDRVPDACVESDLTQLSQVVAREQVRLAILSNILKTFVDWTP